MSSHHKAYWFVVVLMAMGAIAVSARLYQRQLTATSLRQGLWRLTYHIDFEAENPEAKLQIALPIDTAYSRVTRQSIDYTGLLSERSVGSNSPFRWTMVAPEEGQYQVVARFDVEVGPDERYNQPSMPRPSVADNRRWTQSTPSIQSGAEVVTQTLLTLVASEPTLEAALSASLIKLSARSASDVVASIDSDGDSISTRDELRAIQSFGPSDRQLLTRRIYEFCRDEIASEFDEEWVPDDAAGTIAEGVGTDTGRTKAMMALLRAASIPCRLITGIEVREESETPLLSWVEVFHDPRWESYVPYRGIAGKLPWRLVPLRRDGERFAYGTKSSSSIDATVSCKRVTQTSFSGASDRGLATIVDLERLPISMHQVLVVILLLPLGALVTAFFQSVIGLRTIGTFSPTLIALSFVLADWRTGVALFVLAIMIGFLARSALERLKLLMVPRLGFMLTLIVLFLVFTISVLDHWRLTPSPQAVLLPMVILTMTIERLYVSSAEDGMASTAQLLFNTVIVSLCCYWTLRWDSVGSAVLRFPELHLFTLSALAFLGRYTGYRLSELRRFRSLVLQPSEQYNA